jgi:phosphoribosylaminoimidazolecarboxamide formyltransferase / IMP cyclohydrolase
MSQKKIESALISVFYKDGLEQVVRKLHEMNIKIISTGGTYDYITALNIPVTKVEDLTLYPDLFGGRVKTLHPAVMGGILHRRDHAEDLQQVEKHNISAVDLVIVDLYPFEETIKKTSDDADIIEKIDIGGISLIRAAAKNFRDVLVVPSKKFYTQLLEILTEMNGNSTFHQRRHFATYAFQISSHYDALIFNYFNKEKDIPSFRQSFDVFKQLRYGENPHQKGFFYGDSDDLFIQHNGKEISYNNLQDMEAALELVHEFADPAFVIVKHGNACGVAVRSVLSVAWEAALSCDPLSAFGGVIAANRMIDRETAEKMNEVFFEVLCAPSFSDEALKILPSKKNRILLEMKDMCFPTQVFKGCLNGVLVQDRDSISMNPEDWKVVTKRQIPEDLFSTLIFANKIVRHTKSNAIVLAGDQMLYGSGMGQTSRVDAVKLAVMKARSFQHDLNGAVMASDAFFPFADGIESAMAAGIKYIIQPGGSVRDQEVIDFCDENDISMIFTGHRHFKH